MADGGCVPDLRGLNTTRLDYTYYKKRLGSGQQETQLFVDLYEGNKDNIPIQSSKTDTEEDEVTFDPTEVKPDEGSLDDDSEDRFDGAAILAALAGVSKPGSSLVTENKDSRGTFTTVLNKPNIHHAGKHVDVTGRNDLQHTVHDMMASIINKETSQEIEELEDKEEIEDCKGPPKVAHFPQLAQVPVVDDGQPVDISNDQVCDLGFANEDKSWSRNITADSCKVVSFGPRDPTETWKRSIPELEFSEEYKKHRQIQDNDDLDDDSCKVVCIGATRNSSDDLPDLQYTDEYKKTLLQFQQASIPELDNLNDFQGDPEDSARIVNIGPKRDETSEVGDIPELAFSEGYKKMHDIEDKEPEIIPSEPQNQPIETGPKSWHVTYHSSRPDKMTKPPDTNGFQVSSTETISKTTKTTEESSQSGKARKGGSRSRSSSRPQSSKKKSKKPVSILRKKSKVEKTSSKSISRQRKRVRRPNTLKGLLTLPLGLVDRSARQVMPPKMRLGRTAVQDMAALLEVYITVIIKDAAALATKEDKKGARKRMDKDHVDKAIRDNPDVDLVHHQMLLPIVKQTIQ